MISVIIPTFQEEKNISNILQNLSAENFPHEVIVVDGGSQDQTVKMASSKAKVVLSEKGRAIQLNQGAQSAQGCIFLFLHCDCTLESGTLFKIAQAINEGYVGGCLTQRIQNPHRIYRWIEWTGNMRARVTKVFYGDQGIFVLKKVFSELGGFGSFSIFEDVDFSKRMNRKGKTAVLRTRLYTSSRRWDDQGVLKTTLINRVLSFLFYVKFPVRILGKWYRDVR